MKSFIEAICYGVVCNDISKLDQSKRSCYVDIKSADNEGLGTIRFHFYNKAATFVMKNIKMGDTVFIKGTVQTVKIVNTNSIQTPDLEHKDQYRTKLVGLVISN